MHRALISISLLFLALAALLAVPREGPAEGVKTYYKQYSIFTFENQDFLCEPYLVRQNDWLYKIFRQKGEISAEDFPKFLRIFKELNPKLDNIDAIEPGHQILIPLKRVDRQTYEQKTKGIVEVPMLEFSVSLEENELLPFLQSRIIQKGDTVSALLGKEFLKKGGAVSETGEKTFKLLNPEVTDINRIYLGSQILVPDPAILSQPWFDTLLAKGMPALIQDSGHAGSRPVLPIPGPFMSAQDLGRLQRYAQLIQGTLIHQGEIFFPGGQGKSHKVLDLSKTPLLLGKEGDKTLILPQGIPVSAIDQDLLAGMKTYWKELQLQELNKALEKALKLFDQYPSLEDRPKDQEALLSALIGPTAFSYQPQGPLSLTLNSLPIDIKVARIIRENRADLLVNLGNVYGKALNALEEKGYDVLTLSPDLTFGEIMLLVFTKLGFSAWKNPGFNAGGQVEILEGVFASNDTEKYFITRSPLSIQAADFLVSEGITQILLEEKQGQ